MSRSIETISGRIVLVLFAVTCRAAAGGKISEVTSHSQKSPSSWKCVKCALMAVIYSSNNQSSMQAIPETINITVAAAWQTNEIEPVSDCQCQIIHPLWYRHRLSHLASDKFCAHKRKSSVVAYAFKEWQVAEARMHQPAQKLRQYYL